MNPQCNVNSDQKGVSSFLEDPFLALSSIRGVPSPWRRQEQIEEERETLRVSEIRLWLFLCCTNSVPVTSGNLFLIVLPYLCHLLSFCKGRKVHHAGGSFVRGRRNLSNVQCQMWIMVVTAVLYDHCPPCPSYSPFLPYSACCSSEIFADNVYKHHLASCCICLVIHMLYT